MNLTKQRLDLLGTICGVLGAALTLLAVIMRFALGAGNPTGITVAPRSILLGAIAIMVFGCWLKLTAR